MESPSDGKAWLWFEKICKMEGPTIRYTPGRGATAKLEELPQQLQHPQVNVKAGTHAEGALAASKHWDGLGCTGGIGA